MDGKLTKFTDNAHLGGLASSLERQDWNSKNMTHIRGMAWNQDDKIHWRQIERNMKSTDRKGMTLILQERNWGLQGTTNWIWVEEVMLLWEMPFQGNVEGSAYNMMEVIAHVCWVLVKNQLHGMWETNGRFRKDVKISVSSHRRKEIRTE